MQFVFTIQNECILFNVFDVNSIKNVINKKCHQKCRAAMAKHPHARIRVLPFCWLDAS